ncbi:MAG: hypothetical protein N2D54_02295 [Chloroflexota bacterium]
MLRHKTQYSLILLIAILLTGCNLPSGSQEDAFATALAGYATQPAATSEPTATTPPSQEPTGVIVYACQISRLYRKNDLCLVNADGSGFTRLTVRPNDDQFFPSFAPEGDSIVYSSNQLGEYEIYEMPLGGTEVKLTNTTDNSAPAISPDGQQIVYTHSFGPTLGESQLWLMTRNGANHTQLTFLSGGAWDAAWSPDGTQILFASNVNQNVQLHTIDLDGGSVRQVTYTPGLRGRNDWSPDGQWMSTYIGTTWDREIAIFDTNGENLVYLTDGDNNLAPSFSPDGGWITFTSYMDNPREDHGCEIYIMRIDGSDVRRLTNNDYCDWQPRWGR